MTSTAPKGKHMPQTYQQLEQAYNALSQQNTRMAACLLAAKPYVETCADDYQGNPAEVVLAELNAILADQA